MKNTKLFLSGILCLSSLSLASAKEVKPNVIFIAVDDMNDWVAPLGGLKGIKTPNLDRLASMGITFTNAHCAAPASAPSRLSVMTGVHPARSNIMHNILYDGPEWREEPVMKDVVTIEQFFRANGYETLAGGKIYHTLAPPWLTVNQGEPESWDYWWPSAHVPATYQIPASEKVRNPEGLKGKRPIKYFTWGPIDCKDTKMPDYQLVDWVKHELSIKRDKPLFMAAGFIKPHIPWEVPGEYFDMYPLDSIPDLEIAADDLADAFDHGRRSWHKFVVQNKSWKEIIRAYMACISFTDAQIGRLLDVIEASPYSENTIIVLWSDHGMHIGEKENWEKFTLWEESTRVPLMFYAPGVTKAGTVSGTSVSLIDIFPTLAELVGKAAPDNCDGHSLVPLLKGKKVKHPAAITAYKFQAPANGRGYAVRTDKYRYIYYPEAGFEELYDHEQDPNEFINIAYKKELKDVIAEHRTILKERVSDLKWSNELPKGYTISNDGLIRKDDFRSLKWD